MADVKPIAQVSRAATKIFVPHLLHPRISPVQAGSVICDKLRKMRAKTSVAAARRHQPVNAGSNMAIASSWKWRERNLSRQADDSARQNAR